MGGESFFAPATYAAADFVIRSYRPDDWQALRQAHVASYEHLRPWMPWATPDPSPHELEALCRRFAARYLLGEEFVLGLWMGDELVGGTGFHLRGGPLESGNAEIGMWIAASRAGRGLGTRALAAMLAWGFTEWPWYRLSWHCDTRNHASARVAEKNGLVCEGTLRSDAYDVAGKRHDTHIYAILRPEWEVRTTARQGESGMDSGAAKAPHCPG
jgi:RimJ/RimL family protein N-acetyltransferase